MTNTKTLSRRGFTQILGAGAAYAALQRSMGIRLPDRRPPGEPKNVAAIVRLSSNENPYGPAPAALRAMQDGFGVTWRYPDEYLDELAKALARLNGVSSEQVLIGAGSGEILKLAAAAFAGPGRKVVIADPTFESIGRHATVSGAELIKVALTPDYRHDLPKMFSAAGDGNLVYVCNPNNPTASITPKAELRAFLARVPQHTMVLVDEAYHHYVESGDYESVIPLVKDYPNLIVARTFSKIYGMAGLRCGYCVTRTENIRLMGDQQFYDSVNIMAIVAALASVKDPGHVSDGRKLNSDVRKSVCAELDKLGYRYLPSHANFMMIDLQREVRPVIAALRERGVEVGRRFQALPNFLRVTIGTWPQMQAFLTAFQQVVAQPVRDS